MSDERICPACNGEGMVKAWVASAACWTTCVHCVGTGEVNMDEAKEAERKAESKEAYDEGR